MTDRHGTTSRLLTVDQAAERLNVSPTYVRRRLIFERRIAYVKIGRHVRIEEQEIDFLIDRGRVESHADPARVTRTRYYGRSRRRQKDSGS